MKNLAHPLFWLEPSAKWIVQIKDKNASFAESDFNLLPYKPIIGSFNLAANTDIMSKIWKNGKQLSE